MDHGDRPRWDGPLARAGGGFEDVRLSDARRSGGGPERRWAPGFGVSDRAGAVPCSGCAGWALALRVQCEHESRGVATGVGLFAWAGDRGPRRGWVPRRV